MQTDLSAFAERWMPQLDTWLDASLPALARGGERLEAAMRYSLLGGGKRIRALLCLASAQSIAADQTADGFPDLTWQAAVALEMVHAYSLIHDDLPAMDDDDLRRGKPSCHRAFDEATAILAGDALQCRAAAEGGSGLVARLANAAGASGMVLGQAIDLGAIGQRLDLAELTAMHRYKTGALITAAVLMGAQSLGCTQVQHLAALTTYADCIGLAFQVQDDILDVTSDTLVLGKTQGADMARDKPTFVSLLGLEGAQAQARALHHQAIAALAPLPQSTILSALADFVVARQF
jgi:geranylgeranyl diphosphate synthase, type II